MRNINWDKLSTKEIAAQICKHLDELGFEATLTGGACVSIYSKNKYESSDLDFVMPIYDLSEIDKAMADLGFKRIKSHRHYVNPKCRYYVEFPPPPLSIGEEIVKNVSTEKCKTGILKLLSPTDCVKDRLAAYYHWDDEQSLEQAILVAKEQKVNMNNIKRWSENELAMDKFEIFKNLLKK